MATYKRRKHNKPSVICTAFEARKQQVSIRKITEKRRFFWDLTYTDKI